MLVANDDSSQLMILEHIFKQTNFDYSEVVNGEECFKAIEDSLRRHQEGEEGVLFDLVVLDISMPVMDGTTASKLIREEYAKVEQMMRKQGRNMKGFYDPLMVANSSLVSDMTKEERARFDLCFERLDA